jgi:hypothetical protein
VIGDPESLDGADQEMVMLESVAASRTGAMVLATGTFAHAKYYVFDIAETPMSFLA